MRKLAIIGAAKGQLPLCLKAKEMGLQTICFAWEQGAICREYVDKFYPISIFDKDKILEICIKEKIDGIISNASDILSEIVAYISERMNLIGNSYTCIQNIRNKYQVRSITEHIDGFHIIRYNKYSGSAPTFYPCVVKPISGASKKGVHFVLNSSDFDTAINYAKDISDDILIEEYIDGDEISVETISYKGQHHILQITDKETSGPPHFVEFAHHQPAQISTNLKQKIHRAIPQLLSAVDFKNGAAHIELKIDKEDNLYLIEINPRGGGDEISAQLVMLSTGYDYIKSMIEVALGDFQTPTIQNIMHSGICFLCQQTKENIEFFKGADNKPWLIEKNIVNYNLSLATGNYDRNGYIIYQSQTRIKYEE